jgi:transcriptional regulator
MYIPPHFEVTDPETIWSFIEKYSFGLLVSQVGGESFATHLPFLLVLPAGDHRQFIAQS